MAKFLGSCALHLMLYPEVAKSMELMKYTLNNPEMFTNPNIVFLIALNAHFVNLAAECINLWFLLAIRDVENTVIYFVGFRIIVRIPDFYSKALINDKLKDGLL